ESPAVPTIYVPYTLVVGDSLRLVTRTVSDPIQVVGPVAEQIYAIDPDQPITEVHTGAQRLEIEGWARERFLAALFGAFAAVATVLSTIGLYSLVSYAISQQQRDFALRIALGARPIAVARMVVASAMEPMMAGLAIGLVATIAIDGVLNRWLQISLRDPYVLVAIVGVLVGVTFSSSLVPARRAGLVDPMTMLRAE